MPRVIAQQDDEFMLVETGDGVGRTVDLGTGKVSPEMPIGQIAKFGGWEDPTAGDAARERAIELAETAAQ